jgi:hypothetical protein
MKKNESIWHRLTAGLDAKAERKKLWYLIIPCVAAIPAITLGRTRKGFWNWIGTQSLILYRNDNNECVISWVSVLEICDRR